MSKDAYGGVMSGCGYDVQLSVICHLLRWNPQSLERATI
jgi:hypothetical protein